MSKETFLRLTCDYCGTKEAFPADRQPTELEMQEAGKWIQVVKNGEQKFYDRDLCAVNGIKGIASSPIVIPGEAN